MAPIAGMRIWVAFLTFISLSVTISFYSYRVHQINYIRELGLLDEDSDTNLGRRDICSIITAVILFGIYAYSAFTRNKATSFIQNKFLRAILILIPTGLSLYLHCDDMNFFRLADVFACETSYCSLAISQVSLSIITGLFVVIEVAMSFFMSPYPSPKSVDF
ncbi:MAG: hypothetical protein J3R72DRAFT_429155 [Linnemannia gamsii]|nr:MAG: hypothetical protein J3R72DRAFT_429155 [Linnemannia gamsii]